MTVKNVLLGAALLAAGAGFAEATFDSDSGEATLSIDAAGRLVSLKERATGRELVAKPAPFVAALGADGQVAASPSALKREKDALVFSFARGGAVVLEPKTYAGGWTFAIRRADVPGAAGYCFAAIEPTVNRYVGKFANMLSDEASGVCLRAYDIDLRMFVEGNRRLKVTSDGPHPYVGRRFGLVAGRRSALRPGLQAMTREAGVTQTDAGGAWALGSPYNAGSYFMAHPPAETLDEWIEVAQLGGFDVFHYEGWAQAYGHYEPKRKWFPNGDADLLAAIAKIKAAGMRTSAHTYTACISLADPWVTPQTHDDMMKFTSYTLARPFGPNDREIYVNEMPDPRHAFVVNFFANGNLLKFGGELVQYTGLSREKPYRFTGVTRGAWGTRNDGPARTFPAGTKFDYVWEHYWCLHPEPESPFLDVVAKQVMGQIDKFGFDRVYWDANDGFAERPTALIRHAFAAAADQSKHPLQAEASTLGPHNWWFHSAVGAWDYPRFSPKLFHDDHIRTMESSSRKANLMEAQLGWWSIGEAQSRRTLYSREQRLDETEYFASRNAGGNYPMSIHGGCYSSYTTNALEWRFARSLAVLGWYERFRVAGVFTDEARALMNREGAEVRLRQGADGVWRLRETPCFEHRAEADGGPWEIASPAAGEASVRVEALYGADPFDAKGAIPVVRAGDDRLVKVRETPGVSLVAKVVSDAERGAVVELTAKNATSPHRRRACVGAAVTYPRPYLDVSALGSCCAFGLWVKGDGSGALLNFIPESPAEYLEARSDHFIRLDFTGWRYFAFNLRDRDSDLHDLYFWPMDWHIHEYPVYRDLVDLKHISRIGFYLNDIAKGQEVKIRVGEVRAIPEAELVLKNGRVTVAGRTLDVPFALTSGESAELADGHWRLYGKKGDLLRSVPAADRLSLASGTNVCAFAGGRAQVTVFGSGRTIDALTPRKGWDLAAVKRLDYEAVLPFKYAPSAVREDLPDLVSRPDEKARLQLILTGAVDEPRLEYRTFFGFVRHAVVFPVRMQASDMLYCEDGRTWRVIRRLAEGKRAKVAEGVLEDPLPLVDGRLSIRMSSRNPAAADAVVRFVKRYE